MIEIRRAIAVDQSYSRTGIGISEDNKLIYGESFDLSKFSNNTQKRIFLSRLLKSLVMYNDVDIVLVERARTFSGSGQGHFISTRTIKAFGTMISTIVDAVFPLPVYSVDTRSWKSKVLGSASASKDDAVKFVKKFGFEIDHDGADALCMALYPFCKNISLKEEK